MARLKIKYMKTMCNINHPEHIMAKKKKLLVCYVGVPPGIKLTLRTVDRNREERELNTGGFDVPPHIGSQSMAQ